MSVVALPNPGLQDRDIGKVTTMSSSQLTALAPYTEFARAAYCSPSIVQGWNCGEACSAVPGFQVTLTGGDGNAVQYYYVGYWPSQNTVVVAHQGTDPTQFYADLTNMDLPLTSPSSTLFPGIDSSVKVHSGFANEHAKTALIILDEVKRLLTLYNASKVTVVGHSLGGALAELDCVFLSLNLPSGTSIKGVTYGKPRVGNPAWAALFDSQISDYQRITNMRDPIPIFPLRSVGYSQVHGEVHIVHPDDAVECPGDDDTTDSQCTIQSVGLLPNILDHLGPYQGIYVGTIFCT
ncbi:Alpha/Beta hydrolase protein [Scleroderma yunnanense]